MKVHFNKSFKKSYSKRIQPNKNLRKRFEERYDLFVENQSNPILKDHELTGKMREYRAFSITGNIRTVYYIYENIAYFVDIGTHNQVYGK